MALVVALYGVVVALRRARLRAAAEALHAQYEDAGWWRPGVIAGDRFRVRIAHVRRSFLTYVEVATEGPGHYVITPGFFAPSPDWSCVRVPQIETQRVFVVQLSFPGYGPLNEEQRAALERWLERGAPHQRLRGELLRAAKITQVVVDPDSVSASFRGLVHDADRLRRAIDLLRRVAR